MDARVPRYPPLPSQRPPPSPVPPGPHHVPSPQRRLTRRQHAMEGFMQLGNVLRTADYFDDEDCRIWQIQADEMARMNDRLDMLREMVPQRQRIIEALDQEYRLTTYFPDMMRQFGKKDAQLHRMWEQEEERERHRRANVDFTRVPTPHPPPLSQPAFAAAAANPPTPPPPPPFHLPAFAAAADAPAPPPPPPPMDAP